MYIYIYIGNCVDHCSGISGDYNINNYNNNNTRLSEMDEGHHSVKYTIVYNIFHITYYMIIIIIESYKHFSPLACAAAS